MEFSWLRGGMNPRKLPEFKRRGYGSIKRLKGKWRKPRGKQSKQRLHMKGKPKVVRIGYGAPKELRFKHPSGYYEVLVKSLKDLEKIDKTKQAVRIASCVGKKKREEIIKRAKELGIVVLNE
jgi:large subunit ribosomal protein L32e